MAEVNLTPREMRGYRLVCTGLGERELSELYHLLKDELDVRAAFRNPFPPQFEPHIVHEILLAGAAIAGATGNRVLDIITTPCAVYVPSPDANQE